MSPLRTLYRRLRSNTTEVQECRNCGTTLDDEQTACPDCGETETVTFQIPD